MMEANYDFSTKILTIYIGDGEVRIWLPVWDAAYMDNLTNLSAADPQGTANYSTHYTSVPDFLNPVPTLVPFPAQPSSYHVWDWAAEAWALPATALAKAQVEQSAALNATCQSTIYAGCSSAALGSAHTYPTKAQDQANLNVSVTNSLYPNLPTGWTTLFWCVDAAGVWNYAPHTAAQIQKAGADVKAFITATLTHNATRQASVMAATTVAEVLAVVW